MTDHLKNDILQLSERVEVIQKLFHKKVDEIEEKFKHFYEIDKILECYNQNHNFINLNIGGKVFIVKLSLILSNKDTLFYNYLSKIISEKNDIPNEIFFDRNYTYFNLVLDFIRYGKITLTQFSKFEKEDINDELEFYGIDLYSGKKRFEYDVKWDKALSKAGVFTVTDDNYKVIKINPTTCYTHYLTDLTFSDEDLIVELETSVSQTDTYYYIGIINEMYNTTSNCGCCNPPNAYFIRCDGSVHINSQLFNSTLSWNSQKCVIGINIQLSKREISFYKDSQENQTSTYPITSGSNFRVYIGHCNSGSGEITILNSYAA